MGGQSMIDIDTDWLWLGENMTFPTLTDKATACISNHIIF